MKIDGRKIGYDEPPYIVAEMSCNHCGDISNAIQLVKDAKEAGCSAIKVQCYSPDSLTIDADLVVSGGLWEGERLYDLYFQAQTHAHWMPVLFKTAKAQNITMFASVFDLHGLDMLQSLDCPAYKVASFELCHHELLAAIGRTGKPVIASLGCSDDTEALEALRILTHNGCKELAMLHCVSTYPADEDTLYLRRIQELRKLTNERALIGFSDHTIVGVEESAVCAGACILERHIRLPYTNSPDHAFSDNVDSMHTYCNLAHNAWLSMRPCEQGDAPTMFKRSIYCIKDVQEGEPFTRDNVAVIRPGYGLHPRLLDAVLDGVAKVAVQRGEPLTTDNVDAIGVC